MSLSVSISTTNFSLSFGNCEENIRIGPLSIYLGWAMQGVTWKGRFDFICEKTDYRPEGGKRFETWTEPEKASGGYLLGRKWRLLKESLGADEAGQPGPQMGTAG